MAVRAAFEIRPVQPSLRNAPNLECGGGIAKLLLESRQEND